MGLKKAVLFAALLALLFFPECAAAAQTIYDIYGIEPPFDPPGNVLPPLTAGNMRYAVAREEDYFRYWLVRSEVDYVTMPVLGKMATVLTIPPGVSGTIVSIALDRVRLNATTRVHVEVCFLTPSPDLIFGFTVRPHYDRSWWDKYYLGRPHLHAICPGIIFSQEGEAEGREGLIIGNCSLNQWYSTDVYIASGEPLPGVEYTVYTGSYFASADYRDVEVVLAAAANETVKIAITNFAIWDDEPTIEMRLRRIEELLIILGGELSGARSELIEKLSEVHADLKTALSTLNININQQFEKLKQQLSSVMCILSALNATVTSLNQSVVEVSTILGRLQINADVMVYMLEMLDARITSLEDGLAVIGTDVGAIKADLEALSLKVTDVAGGVAWVETSLGALSMSAGELKRMLEALNARIASIEDGLAAIKTDVGELKVSINALNARSIKIEDGIIKVQTALGDISARLEDLGARLVRVEGFSVKLSTSLGELSAEIDGLRSLIQSANASISSLIINAEGNILAEVRLKGDRILMNLNALNASLTGVKDGIALINTSLGELRAELPALAARVEKIIINAEGNIIAELQTLLGPINVRLDDIKGRVLSMQGGSAEVLTSLGRFEVRVERASALIQMLLYVILALLCILIALLIVMLLKKRS